MIPQPADLSGRELAAARPVPPVNGSAAARSYAPASAAGRTLPHSIPAEEHLLSCCMLDGATVVEQCKAAKLTPASFYETKHGIIFDCILSCHRRGLAIDASVIAEELRTSKQLDEVGGYAFLSQVSSRVPTTAQASYFIEKVREQALLRQIIISATGTVEDCYGFSGGIEDFAVEVFAKLNSVAKQAEPVAPEPLRGLFDFAVPPDNDPSVLLGDRYLNRGDMAVLSSTSGMGKSAMTIQMATEWALGRPAMGIRPNGPLRVLIVQAEDTDGDIAEVAAGMRAVLQLTDKQVAEVSDRVVVVTDRISRGDRFIHRLRRLIKQHKPDLVFINPLQSFMDGDVTESRDLGKFLREGLNSLNEPATFGYVIVHHTTKPATGKEKADRQWNEVMYDMAGGAEIINAARAILSLRATPTEGEFNLVLAKRGRRAGVMMEVDQGAGKRLEITTTIPLRHAKGKIAIPGRAKPLPLIYWESRAPDAAPTEENSPRRGPETKFAFSDYKSVFPKKTGHGLTLAQLGRALAANGAIPTKSLAGVCKRWETEGAVEILRPDGLPTLYRCAI